MELKTAKKILTNIKFGQRRNAARIEQGQGLTVQEIEISAQDIVDLCKKQKGKCHWSGLAFDEKYNYISKHPLAISLDRLNNKIGYVHGNVALTLRVFNLGRGSYFGDFEPIMKELKKSLRKK